MLDDTYNASPSSFKAAIDVLKLFPGEKVLVAGDMRELGTKSEEFHGKIGKYAANVKSKDFMQLVKKAVIWFGLLVLVQNTFRVELN